MKNTILSDKTFPLPAHPTGFQMLGSNSLEQSFNLCFTTDEIWQVKNPS